MIGRTNVSGDYGVGDLIAIENIKNTSKYIKTEKIYNFTPTNINYYKVYSIDKDTILLVTSDAVAKASISDGIYNEIWSKAISIGVGGVYSKESNIFATCTEGIDVATGSVIWSRTLPVLSNGEYYSMEIVGNPDSYAIQSQEYPNKYVDEYNIINGQKIKRWDEFILPSSPSGSFVAKISKFSNYMYAFFRTTTSVFHRICNLDGKLVKEVRVIGGSSPIIDMPDLYNYKDEAFFLNGTIFTIPNLETKSGQKGIVFKKDNKWFINNIFRNIQENNFRFEKYEILNLDNIKKILEVYPEVNFNGVSSKMNIDEEANVLSLSKDLTTSGKLNFFKFFQYLNIED